MNITAKPFDQMTLPELRHELKYWDDIIGNRRGWGSALHVAIDFRKECAAMIARWEREEGDRTVVPHGTHHPETTSRKILRTTTGVTNR